MRRKRKKGERGRRRRRKLVLVIHSSPRLIMKIIHHHWMITFNSFNFSSFVGVDEQLLYLFLTSWLFIFYSLKQINDDGREEKEAKFNSKKSLSPVSRYSSQSFDRCHPAEDQHGRIRYRQSHFR